MLSELTARRLLGIERTSWAIELSDSQHFGFEETKNVRIMADSWVVVFWIEVPLRNLIHNALAEEFGARWWETLAFQRSVNRSVANEAGSSKRGKKPGTKFLDDMPFGFWVAFLAPNLDQSLWVPFLHKQFLPSTSRKELHADLLRFKTFRNAIAHHEKRSQAEISEMRQLAIRIARCIDSELVALIDEL